MNVDELIEEARALVALAHLHADDALARICEAQRLCEEILDGNA